MDFEIAPVALASVRSTDYRFKVTTSDDFSDLAASIGAVGLLQPPVLTKKDDEYVIVCGFRRIAACQALKIEHVQARILPAGISRIRCALMAIADNASQRPLNVIEQSRAYAMIQRHADDGRSWMALARSAGLPDSQSAMDRLLPVVDMPEMLQKGILAGHIALPVASAINRLGRQDAAILTHLFTELNTGLSIQRELLETIGDIALRDGIRIPDLIQRAEIKAVLDNADLSKPQRVHELRRLLKKRRFPELSRAEAAFQRALQSVKLNPQIHVQPPPFFEGKQYRITMTVDSRRQLKSLMAELEKLASHSHLLPA